MNYWTTTKEWDGETCFIVCGGESVKEHDLSLIRNRRVIVINSSFYVAPWANFLIFSDRRWWDEHSKKVRASFQGRVVTITPMRESPDYHLMERQRSGGLSPHPRHLALWHTTATAATNLAAHLGVRVINYLGLDGRGGWHHAPHKWAQNKTKFKFHADAIQALVKPLQDLGIQARVTPQSSYDCFERVSFEDMVR